MSVGKIKEDNDKRIKWKFKWFDNKNLLIITEGDVCSVVDAIMNT